MTREQETLLKLMQKALFSKQVDIDLSVDWKEVAKEAWLQACTLPAFEAADKQWLPEDVLENWKKDAENIIINNIRVISNHIKVHDWMTKAGIPYVILKGCASSRYYPDPSLRAMGDVDLFVGNENIEAAGRVLESKGLKRIERGHESHIEYCDRINTYELHFNVGRIPDNNAGNRTKALLANMIEDAELGSIEYGEAYMPSAFHHGLVLLIHSCSHITTAGIGLRHLCDWAVFVNSFTNKEFIDLFERELKSAGMWRFAQALTRASIDYLGADEKEFASGVSREVGEGLIEDILSGGNFGRKDENRSKQSDFIAQRDQVGVDGGSAGSQYFKSKKAKVMKKWPFFRSHPALMPFGLFWLGVIRVSDLITGKRGFEPINDIRKSADERRRLYQSFGLYQQE